MFTDKNDLVSACLEAMSHQQRERIVACRKRRGGNPLQKVLRLTNEYIDNLYTVDHRFLSDISRKIIFAEHYDEHREFWRRELTDYLETCRQEQLLLPEIDAPAFAEQLMSTILACKQAPQPNCGAFLRPETTWPPDARGPQTSAKRSRGFPRSFKACGPRACGSPARHGRPRYLRSPRSAGIFRMRKRLRIVRSLFP